LTADRIPFVDVLAEHAETADEIEAAIAKVVASGQWILGPEVTQFEEEFASYCGVHYAIGVDSGMSALSLSLRALGVGPGDEVIAPANTFVATVLAIAHAGAKPVLVDVDPTTYLIDPNRVAEAITPRTRALVPVHLYGQIADMTSVLALSREAGLAVVEDACQAHGASLQGRRAGSFGDTAAFSFYPSKNLGAYGDGGIVVTNDQTLADELRMLRNYGQRAKYDHAVVGYNHRLDALQAAILRVKLRRLDARNAARREHAEAYAAELSRTDVITPATPADALPVWHLYVVRVGQDRDALREFLGCHGIETGVHYPIPVHLTGAFHDLGYRTGSFPITERLAGEILSLPMYPQLTAAEIARVAAAIETFSTDSADSHNLSVAVD